MAQRVSRHFSWADQGRLREVSSFCIGPATARLRCALVIQRLKTITWAKSVADYALQDEAACGYRRIGHSV